jgi:uncharacterized protein
MNAAELIREARERAGLTQAALAHRAGTRQSAVSAYESGRRTPSVVTLARLVRAAGYEIETVLVDGADVSLPNTPVARRLAEHRREIIEAAARYGARNVRVFGSVARGDAASGSDIDLLVDLPARTGIFTLGAIAREVERLVGVRADVVPASALRPDLRDRILAEAIPL